MPQDYQRGDEPIPGFRLEKLLGRGGFGEVWKATAPGGIQCALKFIKLDGNKGLKEFRSLRLFKAVSHPNLTPINAFWLVDNSGAVLEAWQDIEEEMVGSKRHKTAPQETMIVGSPQSSQARPSSLIIQLGLGERSLTERLEECRDEGLEGIPIVELMDYMTGAAKAIDYLHEPKHDLGSGPISIQHCDIKPQNMLVVGGDVQVCDFGLARALTDTRVTSAALSAAYGAPEVWRGENPLPSSDQYSLAISYFELRTGALPFEENTYVTVMYAHLEGKLKLDALAEPERQVIARATSVKPEDRFPSCRSMVNALRRAQGQDQITISVEIPPIERQRSRRIIFAMVLLCVMLAGLLIVAAVYRLAPPTWEPPRDLAASKDSKLVSADGHMFYDHIERVVDDVPVSLILVPHNAEHPEPTDLPSFYIMEKKVSVRLFRAFAEQNPTLIKDPSWQDEPSNKENPDFPVMGVIAEDAHRFAQWFGGVHGRLPSVKQWHKAAGLFYADAHRELNLQGPFRKDFSPADPKSIALMRDLPLPVGTATHDISEPFHCRDMAGNGLEWTCEIRGRPETIPLAVEPTNTFIFVVSRGRSFNFPEFGPLTYQDLKSGIPDAFPYKFGQPDIGFRIVIECGQAAEIEDSKSASSVP